VIHASVIGAGEMLTEMAKRGERHSGRGHTKDVGSRVTTPRPERPRPPTSASASTLT
jgi:hypothetical protein